MERLLVKWETARNLLPKPELSSAERKTPLGIIAFGSSDGAVIEARDRLAEQGIHADYLRLRAFPFSDEVIDFLGSHETVFVVEQNRDAQMKSLLQLETAGAAGRLISILHYDGMPIPSECVIEGIVEHLEAEAAA
jgi:2-oxoglutarate ferredoxin oxidoreductase subunit alpha